MSLKTSDYLNWYSEEITRYRNLEWQIAGYSMTISYLTALFSIQPDTSGFVTNKYLTTLFVLLVWLSLFFSEIHIHGRLNEFRAKRRLLLESKPSHSSAKGNLWRGTTLSDKAYFIGFLLIPTIIALASMLTIYNR